jgi:hypothetical protein
VCTVVLKLYIKLKCFIGGGDAKKKNNKTFLNSLR